MNKHYRKQYDQAIRYLDDQYAFFLVHVLRIGRPELSSSLPTAAVAFKKDKDGKYTDDFEFLFNAEFADTLNTINYSFILAHETMHILLNHLKLQQRFIDFKRTDALQKRIAKRERLSKSEYKFLFEQQRNAKLFNIAADCVINDYLIDAGLAPEGEIAEMLCRGEYWINENAANLTVTEVFDLLKKQGVDENKDKGESDDYIVIAGDGSAGDYQMLDSHDWLLDPNAAEKMADAIDKFNEEMEKQGKTPADISDKNLEEDGKATEYQKQQQQAMRAGSTDANMEAFVQQHGVELAWVQLLNDLDPDMFKEPGIAPPMISSFHRRRRKLNGRAFRDVYLPVYRKEERREKESKEIPSIVLALDVSGSIGPRDANRFVSLAMTIPRNRIKVFACVFQTTYQEIDIDNPKFRQGGGTSFNAVANFINERVRPELKGNHPKAVVVITDGAAEMSRDLWPDEKEAESYLWLISPRDCSEWANVIKNVGTKKMLDEYIR
jgi:predicted metal-dependent peptidase